MLFYFYKADLETACKPTMMFVCFMIVYFYTFISQYSIQLDKSIFIQAEFLWFIVVIISAL